MSISLTELAANKIKEIIKEQSLPQGETKLRVAVKGGGCSGFSGGLRVFSLGCFGRHGHHHDDGERGKGDERQESIAQKACHGPTSFRVLVSISLKLMDSFLGEGV